MARAIKEKLKNFVHRYQTLEKIILFAWGLFWIARAKLIFRKIKQSPKRVKDRGGTNKVIIFSVRALPTTELVYFDAIFGHAFSKLGWQVKMLYCDGLLDSCDADTTYRSQRPQCFACKNLGSFVRNSLNLDCILFRQYITDSDIKRIKEKVARLKREQLIDYKYLGVDVGLHAQSSAVKYFLSGKLDLNSPNHLAILRKKLIYSMIMTKIASRVYLNEEPKIIFMLHGIYCIWGPFADYFRTKNIDVIVYSNTGGFRFGDFAFIRNVREFELIAKKSWDEFKKTPLTRTEESLIDSCLAERAKGLIGDQLLYRENFNIRLKKQELLKLLSAKKYSKRYVLYPNLAWDACVEGRGSNIFKDIFSLIDTTINYFIKKPNYQLIIKPHPAELVWERGTESIANYISNKYPKLPKNIAVLKPDTPLSAYDLIKSGTIGITFNGTIALEMATRGMPVLVTGDSHYKDAGVVYEIKTLKEYLNLFDNPKKLISFAKNNIELAKKYAYFYFLKLPIKIPFYSEDKWSTINWKCLSNPEEVLTDNSNIIKICRKIIENKDVVNPL